MYNWNKAFNLVMEIKNEYKNRFGKLDTLDFKNWLNNLNDEKYNNVFDSLQTNQVSNFLLIRYGLADMQRGMWEDKDSIFRECRSLVIDLDKEVIVLAPFRKFFNLNEVSENMYENVVREINEATIVEMANKLDGSMQSARWYDERVFMTGSMALDKEDSWRLQEGYEMITENHIRMFKDNQDYTFIFEYISLKDAHVVKYSKKDEGLYLIGVRDVLTGRELNYYEIIQMAEKYNIWVVELENRKLDELIDLSQKFKSYEKEGWVINIDGRRVKIKCDDYVKIHRLLDKLSSVNVIIESIADNKYDDLLSKVPIPYRDRVEKIAEKIFKYKMETEKMAREVYDEGIKLTDNKKDFMVYLNKNADKNIFSLAVNLYLGTSINALKTRYRYKKASEIGLTEEDIYE